jgi:hypothetical protein
VPYRISTPPDPEPQEIEDPYAAVLRGQRRHARLVSALVVIFCAGGLAKVAHSHQAPAPRKAPVTEATRLGSARSAIASARARAAAQQAAFSSTMREAIAADGAAPPAAAPTGCAVALPSGPSLVHGRPAFPLLVIGQDELGGAMPSQAIAEILADARRAEAHLAAGRFEEATLYARALDRPERFGYDVVLVTRANKPVRAISGNTFEPGEIEGRAYVYDFASGQVVCRADVHARSSRAIGYMYSDRNDTPPSLGPLASMDDAIREDIRRQTERAILDALRPEP